MIITPQHSLTDLRQMKQALRKRISYLRNELSDKNSQMARLEAILRGKAPVTMTLQDIENKLGYKVILQQAPTPPA